MNAIKARVRTWLVAVAAATALLALCAGGASAGYEGNHHFDSDQYEIETFSTTTSSGKAGARADFRNAFMMKRKAVSAYYLPYGRTKLFEFDLPLGLAGDPTAVAQCPRETFFRFYEFEGCPPESQIGKASVSAVGVGEPGFIDSPVFNLVPGPNQPAQFGIKFGGTLYAFIDIDVNSDGEITAVIDENPISNPPHFSDVTMFGVPADDGVPGPRRPFMSNPTNCEEPFETVMRGESYEFVSAERSFAEPARTDCGDVPFEASMNVKPTSKSAGDASGLDISLNVPQSSDPDELATAHVKDVTMTFPEGMTVSGSSAAGLESCAPDQFGYHEDTPISCPLSSKIGTVEVVTPILEKPLVGPVYVAKQNDNPFDSLMALYMAPSGSGVTIKLAGKVDLDPNTGRLKTTFLNNPQQPFSELHVKLKDGPRAPLALPRNCGTYTTTAELTSWAMPDDVVPISSTFTVDQGCDQAGAFTPGVAADTANRTGGAFAPFALRVTRAVDGQPNISHFEATLPEGLLAKLAGVPLCPEDAAASAACPEETRIGHTTVGVGAGPSPVFAPEPGKAPTVLYFGGPYKGAPYSVIAKVPAQAGPFDLGTVVVRNALHVDPVTTRVTAKSDPLPQFLQGIPITYRDIRVDVDRPGFTVNPTSCQTLSVDALVTSATGQLAPASNRFGVGACRALGFKPKLSLRLKGGTKRNKYPALTAVMNARGGDANIDRVSVALPRSEFLEQAHIRTICTRVQWAADACPKAAIYGYAKAVTPLLDQPLEGPVYLRSSNNPLPDLVADLRGAIKVELAGRIDSIRGGIRTTFDFVPDAPVTRFELKMKGGQKGLLVNSRDICRGTHRANVQMDGQNGRAHDFRPALVNPACKKKQAAKSTRHRRK